MAGNNIVPVVVAVMVAGGLTVGAAGAATARSFSPVIHLSPMAQPYPPAPDVDPPTRPRHLMIVSDDGDDVDWEDGDDDGDDFEDEGDIVLEWDAATDNVGVAAYDIYASRSPFHLIASVSGDVLTYTDVQPLHVRVSYFVKARDAAGNVSRRSNIVTRYARRPHRPSGYHSGHHRGNGNEEIIQAGKKVHVEGSADRRHGGGYHDGSSYFGGAPGASYGEHAAPPREHAAPRNLPFTGAPVAALAGLGSGLLVLGASTVIVVRRRRSSRAG